MTKRNRRLAAIPLLMVGIIFITLGFGGGRRSAFLGVGVVFIILGIVRFARSPRP